MLVCDVLATYKQAQNKNITCYLMASRSLLSGMTMSWNEYMHSNVYNVYTQTPMTLMVGAHMRQSGKTPPN